MYETSSLRGVRCLWHGPYFLTHWGQDKGRHFPDDIFKCIFLKWKGIISLNFVTKCPIKNFPVLVQIMAWRRSGDTPLSEPTTVSLLTHISDTRPQLVNIYNKRHVWLTAYSKSATKGICFWSCRILNGYPIKILPRMDWGLYAVHRFI